MACHVVVVEREAHQKLRILLAVSLMHSVASWVAEAALPVQAEAVLPVLAVLQAARQPLGYGYGYEVPALAPQASRRPLASAASRAELARVLEPLGFAPEPA